MRAMNQPAPAALVPEKYSPAPALKSLEFPLPALDSGGFDFILSWRLR